MPGASDRFDFTTPPAEYPTADTMLYDRVAVSELTPEQALQALLTAGRVVKRSQSMEDFLDELRKRQDRFNTIWSFIVGGFSFFAGLWLGSLYL